MMMLSDRVSKKVSSLAVLSFFVVSLFFPRAGFCNVIPSKPGATSHLVSLSKAQACTVLVGLKLHPDNPQKIDFIFDTAGEGKLDDTQAGRLIKYFLAGLTIPTKDLWVNLSPYEQNRIVPQALGATDLGKDMLAQDYFLKQLSASLTYPETELGKKYWEAVNGVGAQRAVPSSSFNKIWITPGKAEVYQGNNTVLITNSSLKAMMESDYLAMQKNSDAINRVSTPNNAVKAMREKILPQVENDINNGANFATLRQAYNSLILAVWFKEKFEQSFFKYYLDQAKIKGIDLADKNVKEKIWAQYVAAFKQGAYDYIKKESVGANGYSPFSSKITKRHYFSGGATMVPLGNPGAIAVTSEPIAVTQALGGHGLVVREGAVKGFDLDAQNTSGTSSGSAVSSSDSSATPFGLDGGLAALESMQKAPLRSNVKVEKPWGKLSVEVEKSGFSLRDVWVLVNGQAFNLLSLSQHESFTMFPTVNRIDKEGEWVAPDGKVYKYKFTDEQLAALQARKMALVLGSKATGDQEPGSIHGLLAWNGKRYVVTKSEDGSSVTGTADTNDDPNIPKELQIPELFQGLRLKKTYTIDNKGRVVIANGIINLTGKHRPGQVGDHHWQNVSAEPPLPADASEQERKARDARDATVREQVVLTIPDAKLVYETDPTKQGRWPTGKVIHMGTPQAQAAHLDFTKGQAIGALGGISYNNPSNIYDNVFYLGPVKKGQKYRYITIYNPVSNKTIVIKADVRYTHAVVFTPFWDGARGTLCVELQTAPTNMFKLQKQVREDVNHELDPELGEAVKGLVQGPHEEVELQTTMWAVEGKVDIDQLIAQEEGGAAAQEKTLAGVWPEEVTPKEMGRRIDAALAQHLLPHEIREQISDAVEANPNNIISVSLDFGEGRVFAERIPAAEKYRALALKYLSARIYNIGIWCGRLSNLQVKIDAAQGVNVDRDGLFDALKTRIVRRFDSGDNKRLRDFGNYGRPVEIALVHSDDQLTKVPLESVLAGQSLAVKHLLPEEFNNMLVCFDVGGQGTKVRAFNGEIIELPPELALLSYDEKISAADFSTVLQEHARKVNAYLFKRYGTKVHGFYYNTAGAIEPIELGELAPGVTVTGRAATFATSTDNWTASDKDIARNVPAALAQIFQAPTVVDNDMIGFEKYVEMQYAKDPRFAGNLEEKLSATKIALGTGTGTERKGGTLGEPQEGGHALILDADNLPRSGEQLGLSTIGITNLARAYGFDETGITKLTPRDVGMALKDPKDKNHDIAVKVFTRVGEMLAENIFVLWTLTGEKHAIIAGGVTKDLTGALLRDVCNNSQVAQKYGLSVELMEGDVSNAGAIGGAYAASYQMQDRVGKMAQSWGMKLSGNHTVPELVQMIATHCAELVGKSRDSGSLDYQRAAHDILALDNWGFDFAAKDALVMTARNVYDPNKDTNRRLGGKSGQPASTPGNADSVAPASGPAAQDGGVNLNSLAASLNAKSGQFYFKRGFLTGREKGLVVDLSGQRSQKTVKQIIQEDGMVN